MQKYRCHKTVHAAKIVGLHREPGLLRMALSDGTSREMDPATATQFRHAEEGGYYVIYEDGYFSYSPAKAFEDGYAAID